MDSSVTGSDIFTLALGKDRYGVYSTCRNIEVDTLPGVARNRSAPV